jgi:hypothetical protein
MPVRYERDDARRRVTVAIQGEFPSSEVLVVIERQYAEGTWGYGLLYDMRHMIGRPTVGELRAVMKQARSHPELTRGPVAFLITDPVLYASACTYAAMGQAKIRVSVFRELEEAERWLSEETSPPGPQHS